MLKKKNCNPFTRSYSILCMPAWHGLVENNEGFPLQIQGLKVEFYEQGAILQVAEWEKHKQGRGRSSTLLWQDREDREGGGRCQISVVKVIQREIEPTSNLRPGKYKTFIQMKNQNIFKSKSAANWTNVRPQTRVYRYKYFIQMKI